MLLTLFMLINIVLFSYFEVFFLMFENVENILIAISRYFLIIVGALSFVGAIIFLIYNLTLISDKPDRQDQEISQSAFSDFRYQLFPKKLTPKFKPRRIAYR